jgi:tRNA (mo5U34)-methyltransferase
MGRIRANDEECRQTNEALKQELLARGFYHSIQLNDGTVIEGILKLDHLKRRLAALPVSLDLRGQRVLDIGTWDGFFAFEMERRGAEVMAIDNVEVENFHTVHRLLSSRVDYRVMDVYELSPEQVGRFDVVLFLGVLYHLKHPLLGLEAVCSVTRNLALVESYVTNETLDEGFAEMPRLEFYETNELLGQIDNWVGPNIPCVLALCRTAGFARVAICELREQRLLVACYRSWEPEPMHPSEPAPVLNAAVHHTTYGINFSRRKDDYVAAFFKSPVHNLTLDTVKPEVSGYGVRPVGVVHHGGDGWQANFRLPPGLDPGWHEVRLRTAGSRYSNPVRIAIDIPPTAERIEIAGLTDAATWTPGRCRGQRGDFLSLWVRGLPENADRGNVLIDAGSWRLRTEKVVQGENGLWQVNACFRETLPPGLYHVRVTVGGVSSLPQSLRITGQ